ncbi:phosphotriesterase-related protein [Diachasma alloeum]|uniref:phosphotriesterase-related protein n=1 Tax=Diachasma alloeum TaxID=454923 RepID=UPI00073822B4|nr:phosphotriesterase-related protein [Diachasma alloeum]
MEAATIETVLGPVELSQLGRTLTHEHLAMDFHRFYVPPPKPLAAYFQKKIALNNVGYVKQYPYSSRYNVNFYDEDASKAVIEDVMIYKKNGGGTIVDNTTCGIQRDLSLMKKISNDTGVHVIVGSGYYVEATQAPSTLKLTEEQMHNVMMNELTKGCMDYPSIKAGFIGEVGSSWPITDFEKIAIRATATVQRQLGCPVTFHPGRNTQAPFEIMNIYLEAGGDPKKAIMSHLDRTIKTKEALMEFAKFDCYCQFDLFGIECSYYQLDESTEMPSDAERLNRIKWIYEERGVEQILMSHDIHTKHRLIQFGGHGYSHILTNVIPRMSTRGFTNQDIDTITIENPKTWLTWRNS